MSFSPSPTPRPGKGDRQGFKRLILGVVIGAVAVILGFLIGAAYFLLS
ncbi:MAG TPA: hypothetical protein VH592_00775 [Gemmataceae bacterium]